MAPTQTLIESEMVRKDEPALIKKDSLAVHATRGLKNNKVVT